MNTPALIRCFSMVILMCTAVPLDAFAAEPDYGAIQRALASGNVKALTAMAKDPLDLDVPGNDSAFSRAQAASILRQFFMKNRPKSFDWVHKGQSKQGMRYGIGTLRTGGESYRVTVNLDPAGKIMRIAFEED